MCHSLVGVNKIVFKLFRQMLISRVEARLKSWVDEMNVSIHQRTCRAVSWRSVNVRIVGHSK